MFTLCEDTGTLARNDQCAAHGGDACLKTFVPADPEWAKLAPLEGEPRADM